MEVLIALSSNTKIVKDCMAKGIDRFNVDCVKFDFRLETYAK